MTYKGHIENGVVVFDEPVSLDDGTEVSIEVQPKVSGNAGAKVVSRAELYGPLIGVLKDMPEDWAQNHDYYLRKQHGE